MSHRLTNKQLLVLQVLRAADRPLDGKRIARDVTELLPPCVTCGGSGDGGVGHVRCRACHGTGKPFFDYSLAYQAAQRLVAVGLVERRPRLDAFGDPTGGVLYAPTAEPDSDDPLEQAFKAPAAERDG